MKGNLATLSDCIFVVLQDKNAELVIIGCQQSLSALAMVAL